jgi:uncharacterized protein (TIGR03663 family)
MSSSTHTTLAPGAEAPGREARLKPQQPEALGRGDRAWVAFMRFDGEKIAWVVLLIIALLSRVIGLGDRAMSHDESLHAVYSWKLYAGQGYQHQPMMHGPLKFLINAFIYFIFGVSDWSARLQAALFGVLLIGLVWMLRPWLGRKGAFLAAVMCTISPALLFHSRYIRDEIILCALLVALVIGIFRYIDTRRTKWLIWTAAVLGLALTTMEASFIFGGLFGIFLLLALATRLWILDWPGTEPAAGLAAVEPAAAVSTHEAMRRVDGKGVAHAGGPRKNAAVPAAAETGLRGMYRSAVVVALPLLLVGVMLLAFKLTIGLPVTALGAVAAVAAAGLVAWGWRGRLHAFAELDIVVLLGTLVLPFLSAVVLKLAGWEISQFDAPGKVSPAVVVQGAGVLVTLFVISIIIGFFWLGRRWTAAAGLFWAIEILFFTTFLTNGQGIGTGLIGSLGYWIDQQEVMRGGQPWYYFFLMVPLYEFLPLLLAAAGAITWLVSPTAFHRAEGSSPAQPPAAPDREAPRAMFDGMPDLSTPIHPLFLTFLVFWCVGVWGVFTYVGEKMPWHVVYFALPMALLGGWWIGRVVDGIDWGRVQRHGGWWLLLGVPIFLVALKGIFPIPARRPFAGVSLNGLSNTLQWFLALALGAVLVYVGEKRIRALGWPQSRRLIVVALAAILAVFTGVVAYRFAFVNYDYATEPMVYAHGTPDIKVAMSQIDEISRKIAGDYSLKVAYDDDATWPLEWYLRDYTNRVYYGATPTRDAMDAPVVIAGDKNLGAVRPYLGDRYYEFSYRLIWWPTQTYFGLTPQRIWEGIKDPVQRGQFWDVVINRRYTTPTTQWSLVHRFSVFVRKDVAAEVWDWAKAPAASSVAAASDPYAKGLKQTAATLVIGDGTAGSAPGQLNSPRAVAVGPDGNLYVADSGNNRITVFDATGKYLRGWGSMCKLTETGQPGCVGQGQGQFNEPWGIAVGADGSVYVADTWNHRIEKFDGQGQFVTMWGSLGSTNGELGPSGVLYGPRAVAVGQDGNVYVMDTGNKRVQAFTPDGQFVGQYGGGGVIEGHFDEPVGLAQDGQGNWYVTDTWNHRVEKFDAHWQYVGQWAITGWASQTVLNKPYVAVDAVRQVVYVSDPEGYRVLAFGLDGTYKGGWGQYGNDASALTLPTGLAVGPNGTVYVADGASNRVLGFPPVQ